MLNISLANSLEVILAICFVLVAFAVLVGTFVIAIAYVYSNVFERWPDYSNTKRIQVVRNIVITIATISALTWLASNRF